MLASIFSSDAILLYQGNENADNLLQYGIKPHIFSYYKKKFSSDFAVAKHFSQLVPVKLVADDTPLGSNLSSSSGPGVLRLTHANGFSLEINSHTDMASLKPLLELLRSVS